MSSTFPYRIELLSATNVLDIAHLQQATFGKRMDRDALVSKYLSGYASDKIYSFFAYDGELPIAFFGALPFLLTHKEETVVVLQTCEYMTLKKHRKKGIHQELYDASLKKAKADGIPFVYALMSNQSLASGVRNGWQIKDALKGYAVQSGSLGTGKLRAKFTEQSKLTSWYAKRLEKWKCTSAMENPLADKHLLSIRYDEEYANYRTFTSNFQVDTGFGQAWIKLRGALFVGAMNTTVDQFPDFLRVLKQIAVRIGASTISFAVQHDSVYNNLLEAEGESFTSFHPSYFELLPDALPVAAFRIAHADFDTW